MAKPWSNVHAVTLARATGAAITRVEDTWKYEVYDCPLGGWKKFPGERPKAVALAWAKDSNFGEGVVYVRSPQRPGRPGHREAPRRVMPYRIDVDPNGRLYVID